MKPGPITHEQLTRFGRIWKQGEHVLITAGTGSGKTTLARHILQKRIDRGGHVVMLVCKLQDDDTIAENFGDWKRWKTWKKTAPTVHENKILLWPDTRGMPVEKAIEHQKTVFSDALDQLSMKGKWTVYGDEGLYMCSPRFLNLGRKWEMMHALGRSGRLTMVTSAQRPSNIPVIIYGSAAHAFTGRIREADDLIRLAALQGKQSKKDVLGMMEGASKHDYVWQPIAPDWDAERLNLIK